MEFLVADAYHERHWAGFNKAIESGEVAFDPLLVNLPIKGKGGIISRFPAPQTLLRDAFGVAIGVITVFSAACKVGDDNGLPSVFEDVLTG
jgi:hypothetical protein